MSSSQCCTLILPLKYFKVAVGVDWDTSLESYVSLILVFSCLVPTNHNFTKIHGNMLV
jgi:hypothetical protein